MLIFTVLTGLLYPAVMTGVSELIFSEAGEWHRKPQPQRDLNAK